MAEVFDRRWNSQGDGTSSSGKRILYISLHVSSSLCFGFVFFLQRNLCSCSAVIPSGGCPDLTSHISAAETVMCKSNWCCLSKTCQHLWQYGLLRCDLYMCSLEAIWASEPWPGIRVTYFMRAIVVQPDNAQLRWLYTVYIRGSCFRNGQANRIVFNPAAGRGNCLDGCCFLWLFGLSSSCSSLRRLCCPVRACWSLVEEDEEEKPIVVTVVLFP